MEYKFFFPLDENDIANLPLPKGSASVMRNDLASGNCSALYDEPQPPTKDPTLPFKVSLTKNENFVALGNPLKTANDTTTRADEAVASATNNYEAGNTGGDCEAANTTTTAGNASKNNKKKKPVEKATSSSTVSESATAAKSEDAVKGPAPVTREMRSQMRALLESNGDIANNTANHALFERMFARCPEHSAPTPKPGSLGPVCGNPACGAFGHTLSVCPVPTGEDGDMAGCFFCNVVDHDADDCAMMEWVSPATLVTHLITNRAGMPPWDTRIDWVALAIGEWDLMCFTMLPLTREFVKKEYIPGKRWTEVKGVSSITDPIFEDANLRSLKALAKPKPDDPKRRAPLMEASPSLCYCKHGCYDGLEHTVFKNKIIRKYIAEVKPEHKEDATVADRERALATTQAQMAKKVPKKVTKERKGRRAMKKEAMAAAAAQEEVAGPSEPKKAPAEKKHQVEKELNAPSKDEAEAPLSQRLMELADTVGDVLDSLQKTIKP